MGRLRALTLERVEAFGDRVLDVAEALQKQRRFGRVIDQLAGCGTSSGANVYEADEAMTRKDFAKCLGIVVKELNETRYWAPARVSTRLDQTESVVASDSGV